MKNLQHSVRWGFVLKRVRNFRYGEAQDARQVPPRLQPGAEDGRRPRRMSQMRTRGQAADRRTRLHGDNPQPQRGAHSTPRPGAPGPPPDRGLLRQGRKRAEDSRGGAEGRGAAAAPDAANRPIDISHVRLDST